MGSVSWSWKRLKDEKLFGSRAYETDEDFSSEKAAKSAIDSYFASRECDTCGQKNLSGSNISVELTRVDLHHDVKKKGIFGGEKTVEEHWKTVYRVGNFIYPTAHLFSSGGHLKCQNGHRMGSPGFFGQWAANIAKAVEVVKHIHRRDAGCNASIFCIRRVVWDFGIPLKA